MTQISEIEVELIAQGHIAHDFDGRNFRDYFLEYYLINLSNLSVEMDKINDDMIKNHPAYQLYPISRQKFLFVTDHPQLQADIILNFTLGDLQIKWNTSAYYIKIKDHSMLAPDKLVIGGHKYLGIYNTTNNFDSSDQQAWLVIIYSYSNNFRVGLFDIHQNNWYASVLERIFVFNAQKFGVVLTVRETKNQIELLISYLILFTLRPANLHSLVLSHSFYQYIVSSILAAPICAFIYRKSVRIQSTAEDYPVHKK